MKNLTNTVIFLFLVFIWITSSCTKKKETNSYNILFIAVDDLRPELGCYGNEIIKAPNIDKLASEAVVFNRAYCQQAICMASRASLMSGISPEMHNFYACGPVNAEIPDVLKMDDLFRQKGYITKAFGKIYHHKSDHLDQFGENWQDDKPDKTWEGRGYVDSISKAQIIDGSGRGPAYESPDVVDNVYLDGYLAEQAVRVLDEFSKGKAPFFLAIGFHKPHLPFNAPKRYWDLYSAEDIELPPNDSLPLNYTEHTLYNFGELRNYAGIPKGDDPLEESLKQTLKHGYYASVSYMDAQLGKVLDRLTATGLDKNTIVILWGDHGWKLGEHGMWCKHTNFELDTRVPLMIRVPGQTAGKTQSFAELLDIYPTLSELCGFELPDHLQGTSLVPNIKDPASITREAAFSLYPHGRNNAEQLVMGYSVRTDDFRYIQWKNISENSVEAEELYDHRIDPGENYNVAGVEQYTVDKQRLALKLVERFSMDQSILK